MTLKISLAAGVAFAALTLPTIAFSASTPTSTPVQVKTEAPEDESKAAEKGENAKLADKLADTREDAITERSATFDGHQYAKNTLITLATARTTALDARPGKITDQELEKEHGGSGLRYSFDVQSGTKVYEVGVDAKTGKVIENAIEGPMPD